MACILIVEDDPDQLELRKLLLENAGHEVWTAAGREEANKVFDEASPTVVIMDLRLPRLADGQALIRDLRDRSSTVRIFVESGAVGDLTALPEAGLVNELLNKPSSLPFLLKLISKAA
jgi:two-component system, NtrC family, response regulator